MYSVIKIISDNIYQYFLHHWTAGVTEVKGVDFYQSSSQLLAAPTLCLIFVIATT